ncbi:phospholipase B1, membrane-associated isoform X2 [Patella vulgata]|nr:phospholipase B1, membrane-associated isoform X2 [Patella vulgata]
MCDLFLANWNRINNSFGQAQCSSKDNEYRYLINKIATRANIQNSFKKNLDEFGGENVGAVFPCTPIAKSDTVPTSVHQLRPGDIKIVAALGDSLTAGMGITAKNIFSVLTEDRGLVFSIGGDGTFEEYVTLPNILKRYNPNITGYSIKTGGIESANSRFNLAESGNVFSDLTDEATMLITRIQADINIDINNDWKLITILIGDNDLCKYCNNDGHEAERYKAMLEKTLRLLQANLPRTIVNLVEVLNVEIAKDLNKGLACSIVHYALCPCAAFPKTAQDEADLRNLTNIYQQVVKGIATSGQFDTKDDFTVVDQPFFRNTYLPVKDGTDEPDFSFFSPDCFHLSEKGHSTAATALWNNMFQPVGKKDLNWKTGNSITCPTEQQPYIYTSKNSGGKKPN